MRRLLSAQIEEARRLSEKFFTPENEQNIVGAADVLAQCFRHGGKALTCGNGGSMCDAMHLAEELAGRYRSSRPPLPAFAVSDPGYLTCAANDFGYERVFSRYVEAFLKPGDVLVAFSTSGNSPNVVQAAESARNVGARVIALTGNDGGKLKNYADVEIRVPYFGYADRIQEIHIQVVHALIACVEYALFPELYSQNPTATP
ncbi:MAG: D-sedoheptulose 7-phosphate isomerase [Bacteroidia bacterium]|nr:D-sedoheptulose 7-phosphate isomerase [Bacteroidia bacterium]